MEALINKVKKLYVNSGGVVARVFLFSLFVALLVTPATLAKDSAESKACGLLEDDTQKILCWKKLIDARLKKGDLDKSMDLVGDFYQTDSVFAANCHDFTHSVGKKAYEMFSKGTRFKVGDKTSYCAYGFYHGFMESLVSRNGDINTARDFCNYVDAQVSKTSSGATLACYHGIGHGWTNVHDKALWGDEQKMIQPALALCEKVTSDPEELKICATGVFDSISIGYYNSAYGLEVKKKDPYWICKMQNENYKKPCYMDITPAAVWVGEHKLVTSLKFIPTVEPKYRDIVIDSMAQDVVRFVIRDGQKVEDQIKACKTLTQSQSDICLTGLATGYLQFGPPREEEKLSLEYCASPLLSEREKGLCYSKILDSVRWAISIERQNSVCEKIPDKYKNGCSS